MAQQHLISFATDELGTMVSIHLDLAGTNFLISELESIRDQLAKNDCPHTHLFSGDELSVTKLENKQQEANSVVHVKIYGWNDEWADKHGLRPEPGNDGIPTT